MRDFLNDSIEDLRERQLWPLAVLLAVAILAAPVLLMKHGGGAEAAPAPQRTLAIRANALCERLLGTLRRECLDYLIPLAENHLRGILAQWVPHYNTGRPHMSLGPGIPQPPPPLPVPLHVHRHQLPNHLRVVTRPILGGLHHEYRLAKVA
jgi:hypothetical protein